MNQATIRALSQVRELVKEKKHDPRQKFIREKDVILLCGILLWDEVRDKRFA